MTSKKTGDNLVDTGGGTYVGGNINTGGGDFVGRDKIDNSNRSVSVGGNVGNSNIVTGDHNQVSNTVTQTQQNATPEAFIALIAQMQTLISQAGLAEHRAEAAANDLQTVTKVAKSDKPDGGFIAERLEGLKKILDTTNSLTETGEKLLPLAKQAIDWARVLFGI
jgi:hypothetical protein